MMTEMTPERFNTLLQSYGASRAHWPEQERAALDALLAQSPETQAAWQAEVRLDDLLLTAGAPEPSGELARRIENLMAPPRPRQSQSAGWLSRLLPAPVLRPALIVASGLLGLSIGIAAVPQRVAPLTYEAVDITVFSGGAIHIRIAEIFEDQQ